MTRRRWIADEISGTRAALVGEQAVHLARVLRARVGQEFEIAADGRVRLGRVAAISLERVEFELGEDVEAASSPDVHLLLAVFKFDRMEWAIEKATELGASSITPVLAQRSERNLCAAAEKRVERWRRIAREAAQQSRRSNPPEIFAPTKVSEILKFESAVRIVLAPEGAPLLAQFASSGRRSAIESVREVGTNPGAPLLPGFGRSGRTLEAESNPRVGTALAIGPEGGWTDSELTTFRDSGWTFASLGPTILRAETAAIAALAIVTQLISNE